MIHAIQNYFIKKKITKLRPIVKRLLENDLGQQEKIKRELELGDVATKIVYGGDSAEEVDKRIDEAKKRLVVESQYILLVDHLKDDPKKINELHQDFLKYLVAINYL